MQCKYGTVLLLLPWTLAFCQAPTGEIAGSVYDASGEAVPNAAITVRNAATGFGRALRSNQAGQYSVASLAADRTRCEWKRRDSTPPP